MTSKTVFYCDWCEAKLTETRPLVVTVNGEDVARAGDFCTWECAQKWFDKLASK